MKLYKYLSYESALKTLSNNSVLLNNPLEYNDPFDCVIRPRVEDEKECYRRMVNYFFFKEFANIILNKKVKIPFWLIPVRWEMKAFKKIMKRNPYYDKMSPFDWALRKAIDRDETIRVLFRKQEKEKKDVFLKTIKKRIDELSETLLVSCFSKTNDSILMWSHYGDKHRGVCIEFEVDPKDYVEVEYSKRRRQIDLKGITAITLGHDFIGEEANADNPAIKKSLTKLLTTKSVDWEYESEYRTIRSSKEEDGRTIFKKDKKYFLKMPEIKRVFVGCRFDKNNLEELHKTFGSLEIIEMVDSENDYKVYEKTK